MVVSTASLSSQKTQEYQANGSSSPQGVLQAIRSASNRTGVDFAYLVNQASQESGFDPSAKASTSSATGLYQFTSQTWLKMMKESGSKYGLGSFADKISIDANGTASVKDPAARQAILNLRNDPQTSSLMACELDKQNCESLQQNVGGKIGATEVYLAHFLGANGASDFISTMRANPNATAADVLPEAASANSSVFYSSNGQPKTLAQIYDHFAKKFNSTTSAAVQYASAAVKNVGSYATSIYTSAHNVAGQDYSTASNWSGMSATKASFTAGLPSTGSSSLVSTMILAQSDFNEISMPDLFKLRDAEQQDSKKQSSPSTGS